MIHRTVPTFMLLILQRRNPIGLSLPGELFIDGHHAAWTLENHAERIPAGTYPITLYGSPHLGRIVPLLNGVPGRSKIEIHWGSYPENYKGCIGVGKICDERTGDIFQTQSMFEELFPAIEQAVESEGCSIEVRDSLPNIDLSAGDL